MEIKKSFKKTLIEKRLLYGKLCSYGVVNQNLRFSNNFKITQNLKDLKEKDENNINSNTNIQSIIFLKTFLIDDISLSLNEENFSNMTHDIIKNLTDKNNLKINLNENFRDEIEKLNYDVKFNINLKPSKREINLLNLLREKITKLNSLD